MLPRASGPASEPMLRAQMAAAATTIGPENQGQTHGGHDEHGATETVQLHGCVIFVAPTTAAIAKLPTLHARLPPQFSKRWMATTPSVRVGNRRSDTSREWPPPSAHRSPGCVAFPIMTLVAMIFKNLASPEEIQRGPGSPQARSERHQAACHDGWGEEKRGWGAGTRTPTNGARIRRATNYTTPQWECEMYQAARKADSPADDISVNRRAWNRTRPGAKRGPLADACRPRRSPTRILAPCELARIDGSPFWRRCALASRCGHRPPSTLRGRDTKIAD